MLLPYQGKATVAYGTRDYVIKIAHESCRDHVLTEALVAPLARAAGVRTPALIAWKHGDTLAYGVWERAPGEPLDDVNDPAAWRAVGRELAKLHTIERANDPRSVLAKPDKRDARPYLIALSTERRAIVERWLERLDRAPPAAPRLTHYDVHGLNVIRSVDGSVSLIDWGDAAWADPAADFGSIPIRDLPYALEGYEEIGSLGSRGEGRVLRAAIGQAVRKAASGWEEPLEALLAWAARGGVARFSDWLPPMQS